MEKYPVTDLLAGKIVWIQTHWLSLELAAEQQSDSLVFQSTDTLFKDFTLPVPPFTSLKLLQGQRRFKKFNRCKGCFVARYCWKKGRQAHKRECKAINLSCLIPFPQSKAWKERRSWRGKKVRMGSKTATASSQQSMRSTSLKAWGQPRPAADWVQHHQQIVQTLPFGKIPHHVHPEGVAWWKSGWNL